MTNCNDPREPGDRESPRSRNEDPYEAWRRTRGHRHRARKERILHTRISEQLSKDIRRVAEDLRVPVSNLVRNVLEEAFGAVEHLTDEFGDLLDDVFEDADLAREEFRRGRDRYRGRRRGRRRRRGREEAGEEPEREARETAAPDAPEPPEPAEAETAPPSPDFADVLGWQSMLLNQAQACASCERGLAAGEKGYVAMTEQGLSRRFLCRECMRERRG